MNFNPYGLSTVLKHILFLSKSGFCQSLASSDDGVRP